MWKYANALIKIKMSVIHVSFFLSYSELIEDMLIMQQLILSLHHFEFFTLILIEIFISNVFAFSQFLRVIDINH